MSECFGAVEFRRVPSPHPQKEDIRLQLEFTEGLLPKPEDQVLVMTVGWKTLDERISSFPTNGCSDVTFTANRLVGNSPQRSDKAFQFLYIQENGIVGVSYPFLLEEDEPEQDVSGDEEQKMLSGANGRLSLASTRGWSLLDIKVESGSPLDVIHVREKSGPLQVEEKADDELGESTKSAAGSYPQAEPDANLRMWTSEETTFSQVCRRLEIGQMADEKSCKKRSNKCVDSFVVVPMSSGQAFSDYVGREQVLLTDALRERDKVAKMYEREKSIGIKQKKRNKELQTACEELQEDNRKLKETLQEVESHMRLMKARQSICRPPSIPSTSVPLSAQTHASVSHITQAQTSRDKRGFVQKGGDGMLSLAMSERSSLFSSLTEVPNCPLCKETFDKTQGATQFQRHVHSHFAEEDEGLF